MLHPIPNLAVNPIYAVAWLVLALWFAFMLAGAITLWRTSRRLRDDFREHVARWIVTRSTPGPLRLPPGTTSRTHERQLADHH